MMKKSGSFPAALLVLLGSVWIVSQLMNLSRAPIQILVNKYIPKSALASLENGEQDVLVPQITPMDLVWDMMEQVDKDRALNDLHQFTGEEPICINSGCYTITNRRTGSEGLDWAQDYLYENLVDLGYEVELDDWSSSGLADQNLIARKEGVLNPAEEVYFVAHVDGARTYEADFPAADDNASSVVNSLELARIMSNYEFERTLVLFFSSGEEQGALGVKAYLGQLSPEELGAIEYVVNRDMTGYDGNDDGVMELFHGNHPPSMALTQMMSEIIEAYQLDLVPMVVAGCP